MMKIVSSESSGPELCGSGDIEDDSDWVWVWGKVGRGVGRGVRVAVGRRDWVAGRGVGVLSLGVSVGLGVGLCVGVCVGLGV